MKKLDTATEASIVYDDIYGHIAAKEKYRISNATKSARIEQIMAGLTFDETTALRVCRNHRNLDTASKISGIDKRKLSKQYKIGMRHLYSPRNISIAIPKFYKLKVKNETPLKKEDFDDQVYIVNALRKSGIDTREKLFKHLDLGWYYLWSLPGCGDNARQTILKAIDKWIEESVKKV